MTRQPLTAREVYQVLKDIAMGERVMRKTGAQTWAAADGTCLAIAVDGWHVALGNDGGALGHCADCVAPDGRAGTVENWGRFGSDPTQLLSQWERAQLEQMLRALR